MPNAVDSASGYLALLFLDPVRKDLKGIGVEAPARGNGEKGLGDKVCPSRTPSEHKVRHCLVTQQAS